MSNKDAEIQTDLQVRNRPDINKPGESKQLLAFSDLDIMDAFFFLFFNKIITLYHSYILG